MKRNNSRNEVLEEEEAELEWEIHLLGKDKQNIALELAKRSDIDMNMKTHELIVDLLNLIFGKSDETDNFWDFYLLDECKSYFKI